MKKLLTFLTLLTLFFTAGWAEEVTDHITRSTTGVTAGSQTYSDWSEKTCDGGSTAVYAGNSAGQNDAIQLRSKNSNSGIVSTTSGGKIKKVRVNWDSNTTSGQTLNIYGSNTAYTSPTELYGNSINGTKLGTIVMGTSTELEITGDYTYIGLRSNSGAMYIVDIWITWETGGGSTTYNVNLTQTTGGTISASPTTAAEGATVTLTATPDSGYGFTSWTVLDGEANEVTVTNNQFTMPASDVEVEATFTELTTRAITVTGGTASPASAYAGQTVTVTPTIPDGKVVDQITTVPASLTLTASGTGYTFTMPNEAVTVTFTFKDAPVQSNRFERITRTEDLETGVRYLLVYEDANKAAGTTEGTNKYLSSISTTIANNTITLDENSSIVPFTLSGSEGSYKLADPQGRFITPTAAKSLKLDAEGNVTAGITFSGNNVLINFGTTLGIMYYNTSYPRFLNYTSEQGFIQLYKEVTETTTDKLYLIGYGMNGTENWNLTTAPQMTYSTSAGTYAVDVYFDKAQRGMFQFAKGLSNSNSNWDGLTGRLYPSTNGSNVSVDTYDMDGTVGLYFTDNSNMYSFELPAGLYTITANLSDWKTYVTQHEVTMTATANGYFDDSKNVTLSSNLTAAPYNGKIYYTTDGTDPKTSSTRQEYTGTLSFTETTTLNAVAELGYIYSEVVERTYTKTPKTPVISPESCTFSEPLTVTITCETAGATIRYTLDGTNPTSTSTEYTAPLTISETTTVKARAFVGETYSNGIATAEFTYSDVQPSTGDFVLVTSASQLVAGNEYIIMSSYEDDWEDVYNVAFGAISSNSGTSLSEGFTVNGNIGESGSTVSLTDGSSVNVLTLGGSTGAWNLKQSNDYYIVLPKSDTKLSTSASACSLVITIGSDYAANIQNKETTDSRQLRYYITSNYFRNYTTSQGKTENVYLYTRESNSVQPPVFTPSGGVYDVPVDVTISCATTGASIYYTTDGTEPSATNGTLYDGEEFLVSETTTYKAVAVKNGNTSSVVTAEYTIAPHTAIETVTLDYSEPFTAGIGKFTVQNVSGFAPVWTLDGEFGIKGTSYSANTNPTNNAAESRFLSPIIDMTDATQPELTFSHQINSYFTDVTNQCQLFIRETTDGTDGAWVLLPITFSDPAANGGWTNDVANIDLSEWAGKKVQISFLYTNPTEGSGAGTWEIQHFVVADNSEYKMVNNIAEFLALPENTKAKFRNPVTVLYDYAQYSHNSYHEYIWVKDESGYMQFYLVPTLNSSTESTLDSKAAYYENGDIIPGGFVVTKNYYTNGKYIQAFSDDALNAGFQAATQKGLADPEYMDFNVLKSLNASSETDVANWSNHYITLEKIKLTSSSKNFNFQDENGTTNSCVGYNKYNGDGSLLKDGTTSADVLMPTDLTKYYNVKAILQLWQGGWEIMPIEFTEWKPAEVTLRKLCADGVEQNTYTISNPLQVVYVDTDRKSVWVKDGTGQSIWSTSPEAPNAENFAIEYASNTRSQQAYYDQSNWCQLVFDDEIPTALVNLPIIKGGMITGKFTNKMNPTLENVELGENFVQTESSSYATNYYVAANFNGPQLGYFFMNPKPQEYADIVWAIYDSSNQTMIMTNNSNKNPEGFEGSFKVNMSMNVVPSLQLVDGTQTGKGYEHFHAIIRLTSATSNAPMLKDRMPDNTEYVVFPLDIKKTDVPTAINGVSINGEVKSVKYVNVAGVVSDKPFSGVNIVVTEYTDGSRSTTKMLRK